MNIMYFQALRNKISIKSKSKEQVIHFAQNSYLHNQLELSFIA